MGRGGVGGHAGISRGDVLVLVMPRMRGLAGLRPLMLAIDAHRSPRELHRHPGQQENDKKFAHGRDLSELQDGGQAVALSSEV